MEAGWVTDPFGRHQYRYWDGNAWTAHVADNGVAGTDDPTPPPPPPAPPPSSPVASEEAGNEDPAIAAYLAGDEQGDVEATVMLGQMLRKAGRSEEAREAFERGHALGHPEAAMCLGNMLSDLGDRVGARAAFERGIVAGSTMAALNLGLMLAESGEVDDALHYLRIAREQGDPEAYWAIGKLLQGRGDDAGAAEAYRVGADLGFGPAAYGLGFVLYESDDHAGAKAAWERALELGHEEARQVLEALERESAPAAPHDDELAQQLAHQLAAACREVMRLHDACFESGTMVQKAEYVASQPQAEASRNSFLQAANRHRRTFLDQLAALTEAQRAATDLRSQFEFVAGAPGQSMDKLLMPFLTRGVIQGDEITDIMVGGIVAITDFGTTVDDFYAAESRLSDLFQSNQG
jgi:tetratricopeptide (TPR) repeat protein